MRVPARSRAEAKNRYIQPLQRTLSCLSKTAVWRTVGVPEEAGLFKLELSTEVVALRQTGARDRLWFAPAQLYSFVRDDRFRNEWKVKTHGYAYTISDVKNLSQEMVAWHWHPSSRPDTHLHVGKGHPDLSALSHRAHLPTGRVSLEEVVGFLIADLGVPPARSDWREVLQDCLASFREWRLWT